MENYNKVPIKTKEFKLNQEQIRILLKNAQNGCEKSRSEVIEANLKLVLNIAHRFRKKENFEDLFQIGTIGLIKAIDNFDMNREVKFSTYAVPMIMGEIRRYLRDSNSSIRVGRRLQDCARKIWEFKEEFLFKNDREPTLLELENALNMEREDLILALDVGNEVLSINAPINNSGEDRDLSVEDRLEDARSSMERWVEAENLRQSFKYLTEKERKVLELRFYLDKTQTEIGEELGISQAQISRLEKTAIKKMRNVCVEMA